MRTGRAALGVHCGGCGRLRPADRKSNGANQPEHSRVARDQSARRPRGHAVDHLHIRERAGLVGPPHAAAHAVFVQGSRAARFRAQRGVGNSRRRRRQPVAGNEAQWPGKDRSAAGEMLSRTGTRRSDPDSISEDMLMSVFEDREGNIWVGTATTGLNRFQRKPLAVQALPQRTRESAKSLPHFRNSGV